MKRLNHILHYNYLYLLLVSGSLLYCIYYFHLPHISKINHNQQQFIAIITDYKIEGNLLTIEFLEQEKLMGYYYFNTKEEKENFKDGYQLGDTVLIKGMLSRPRNNTIPNQLNYRNYLKSKHIYYQVQIDSIVKKKDNDNLFYTMKNKLYHYFDSFQCKEYLYTFLLGNKNFLDSDKIVVYQQLGISHLFAISGMHIAFISGFLLFIFKKIKFPITISYLVVISFLIFYMFLLGNSSSVCRAVLSFSILGISKILKLELKSIHVWCIVFSLLIFKNPYSLWEIGFQYSFTISFFLLLLQNILKGKSYFQILWMVSMISNIVSIPITLYYFYEVNLFSVVVNCIFVPLVSFIIYPLCFFSILFPFLDSILKVLLSFMEYITYFFSKFMYFELILGKPQLWWILLYYLLLSITILLHKKWGVMFLVILLLFQYFQLILIPKNFFIMVDVGQGDSVLFHIQNQTILLDTGGKMNYPVDDWKERQTKSLAENSLIPLLKSYGIKKLDYLILSHGDYDHMGEAIHLINNFRVNHVIFNNDGLNELEMELITVLEKKKIQYYKGLKELNIGKDKLYFLNTKIYTNENDNSNVIYFPIYHYKFLFMGDAGITRENDILNQYNLNHIDFLKIGHHGSNTSSSEYFINNVKPKNCLISVGQNNRYHHPKESVLDILDDYCDIYRTDLNGSIEIKINKNNYKIKTYNP